MYSNTNMVKMTNESQASANYGQVIRGLIKEAKCIIFEMCTNEISILNMRIEGWNRSSSELKIFISEEIGEGWIEI